MRIKKENEGKSNPDSIIKDFYQFHREKIKLRFLPTLPVTFLQR